MYFVRYFLAALLSSALCTAQNLTQEQLVNAKRTMSVGVILFPGFEPLDVYGPLAILYESSGMYKISLHTIGHRKGPVSTRVPPHAMEPGGPVEDFGYSLGAATEVTSTFSDAPPLDVILIPGGLGNMALVQANDTSIEDFVARRAKQADYILSVCTGAVHLARSGLLNGEPATTNKALYDWVTTQGPTYKGTDVKWQPSARWVEAADGKIWTSSGVQAGMDMTYAWMRKVYGDTDVLKLVMNGIEYAPHTDAKWDPFSVVHKVPGADTSRDLKGCVTPVGFS